VLAGRLFGKVVCEEPERYVRLEASERGDDGDRAPILRRSIRGFRTIRPKCEEADNAA
jgi:hypothetical protein